MAEQQQPQADGDEQPQVAEGQATADYPPRYGQPNTSYTTTAGDGSEVALVADDSGEVQPKSPDQQALADSFGLATSQAEWEASQEPASTTEGTPTAKAADADAAPQTTSGKEG
jgi:hypothetical protein